MKAIIIFLILSMSLQAVAQDGATNAREDTLLNIQEMIRRDGMVSTRFVGFAGAPSNQWHRVAYLLSIATPDELIDMANDRSPALRLAAYAGMLQGKHPGADEVRKELLRDSALVRTMAGCIVSDMSVQSIVKYMNSWFEPEQLSQEAAHLRNDVVYRHDQYLRISGKAISYSTKPNEALN